MTQRSDRPAGTDRRGGIGALGPEVALVSVVAMWASTFIVTKDLFERIDPLALTMARFVIITSLALGALRLRNQGRLPRPRRADLPVFALAGLCGYTLYQLGFVLGLDRTSPFSSSLLIAMVPLFTTTMLALAGESPPRRAWFGLAVAVAGVVVFLLDKRGGGSDGSFAGDTLSLGAAVAFAAYGIVSRPLVRTYPIETYTAYTTVAGAIPLLVLSLPAARAQDWGALSLGSWLAIAYLSVFPVYVAYQLWNYAIAHRGAVAASTFSLLVPIVSGFLSALVFDERFGPRKTLGAALVLAGLVVVRMPIRRGAK